MKTYEAFAAAIDRIGIKGYARLIGKSEGYIYKQCWPPAKNGRPNFIDAVMGILHENIKPGMDVEPILQCICAEFGHEAAPASLKKDEVGEIVEYVSKRLYEQPALAGMDVPKAGVRRRAR